MSTRYVWEKNAVSRSFTPSSVPYNQYGGGGNLYSKQFAGYAGTGITLVKDGAGNVTGAKLVNPTAIYTSQYYAVYSVGRYFAWRTSENIIEYVEATGSSGYWRAHEGTSAVVYVNQTTTETSVGLELKKYTLTTEKGGLIGTVASAQKTAYPTASSGAETGGYWYTYKGSDTIDPQSIQYPIEDLAPGAEIMVSLTPSASKTYGGTVSYWYQYSADNGAWTDAETTTGTSITFTIPENASSIRFRVRASDDMGFTSTDYVTGATATVVRTRSYVGVSGKARRVEKIYVGVGGKARQVVQGYIGVNGKARKFL